MANEQASGTETKSDLAQAAPKEYLPISGPELAQLILVIVARDLAGWQQLGECAAFPGARVDFAVRITPQPVEEGRVLKYEEQYTLDLAQPPDVLRIISGLPLWGVVKVALEGMDQKVEKPVEPSEELKKAAGQVVARVGTTMSAAGGPKLPVQPGKGGQK
jgi:hypothetical protein